MNPNESRPGIRTSEFVTTSLAGGSVFALAGQTVSADMSLGAGIAVGACAIALGAMAVAYARVRGSVKS